MDNIYSKLNVLLTYCCIKSHSNSLYLKTMTILLSLITEATVIWGFNWNRLFKIVLLYGCYLWAEIVPLLWAFQFSFAGPLLVVWPSYMVAGWDPRASQNVTSSTLYWSNQSRAIPYSEIAPTFGCEEQNEYTGSRGKHLGDWLPHYMTGYTLKFQTKWLRRNHQLPQDLQHHLCGSEERGTAGHLMDLRTGGLQSSQYLLLVGASGTL